MSQTLKYKLILLSTSVMSLLLTKQLKGLPALVMLLEEVLTMLKSELSTPTLLGSVVDLDDSEEVDEELEDEVVESVQTVTNEVDGMTFQTSQQPSMIRVTEVLF